MDCEETATDLETVFNSSLYTLCVGRLVWDSSIGIEILPKPLQFIDNLRTSFHTMSPHDRMMSSDYICCIAELQRRRNCDKLQKDDGEKKIDRWSISTELELASCCMAHCDVEGFGAYANSDTICCAIQHVWDLPPSVICTDIRDEVLERKTAMIEMASRIECRATRRGDVKSCVISMYHILPTVIAKYPIPELVKRVDRAFPMHEVDLDMSKLYPAIVLTMDREFESEYVERIRRIGSCDVDILRLRTYLDLGMEERAVQLCVDTFRSAPANSAEIAKLAVFVEYSAQKSLTCFLELVSVLDSMKGWSPFMKSVAFRGAMRNKSDVCMQHLITTQCCFEKRENIGRDALFPFYTTLCIAG